MFRLPYQYTRDNQTINYAYHVANTMSMANRVQARKTGDAAKRLRADCALSGPTGGLFKTSVKRITPFYKAE